MNLFILNNKNQIDINPATLLIHEFKAIWDSDTSKDKATALRELAYVYFKADFKSTYLSYPPEEREEVMIEDIFKSKWTPNRLVQEAIKKYEEFQQVPALRLLNSARRALDEIVHHFNTVDLNEKDKSGKPIYKPKDLTSAMGDCGKMVESIDQLTNKVKKELQESAKARGGEEASPFEDYDFNARK